jgi:hypothetical protein
MAGTGRPDVEAFLASLGARGRQPLTVPQAGQHARWVANQLGDKACVRLVVHNGAWCVTAGLGVTVVLGAFLAVRPGVVPGVGALALIGLVVGVLTAKGIPGRGMLRSSILALGGVGRIPVPVLKSSGHMRDILDSYAGRRLNAAQLDTFHALAGEYTGTARDLVTVSRSLT